ncbi:MAG: hypothetical protein NTZ80_03160 [Patescibacteria group bacterium]|nr:hypothetical protein [Patescibacteria group bacterium]
MNYKSIIAEAYQLTSEHPNLHWFGFWPAILDILAGGAVLFYQIFATLNHILNPKKSIFKVFEPLFDFAKQHLTLTAWLAVIAGLVLLLRFIVPVICNASLIQMIAGIRRGKVISGGRSIAKSFLMFIPLFELSIIIGFFSLHTILIELAFTYRNLPPDVFELILIPMIFFGLFTVLAAFFIVYAEFFLILEGKSVNKSIGSSLRMVMQNFRHTIILGLLMLTIGIRILISVILIGVVPAAIGWLSMKFFANLPINTAITLAGVVGLIILYFSGRLLGAVNVLITGGWTITFLELKANEKMEEKEEAALNEMGVQGSAILQIQEMQKKIIQMQSQIIQQQGSEMPPELQNPMQKQLERGDATIVQNTATTVIDVQSTPSGDQITIEHEVAEIVEQVQPETKPQPTAPEETR